MRTIPAGLDRKEAEIFSQLDPSQLPKHVAIIMDGNGRWAKRRHLPRIAGHKKGVEAVRLVVETAARIKLPALTRSGRHWTGDGSGEGIAISAHSPHREMALAFVRYLFSPAVYKTFIKNTQQFPSIPSAQNMVTNPIIRTMIGYLPDGTDHILFGAGSWNAVSNAVTAVVGGSLTPTAAAAQVQASVLKTRKGRH